MSTHTFRLVKTRIDQQADTINAVMCPMSDSRVGMTREMFHVPIHTTKGDFLKRDMDLISLSCAHRLTWVQTYGTHYVWDWAMAKTSDGNVFVRIDGALLLPVPLILSYLSIFDTEHHSHPWPTSATQESHQALIGAADEALGPPRSGMVLTLTTKTDGTLSVEEYPSSGYWGELWATDEQRDADVPSLEMRRARAHALTANIINAHFDMLDRASAQGNEPPDK